MPDLRWATVSPPHLGRGLRYARGAGRGVGAYGILRGYTPVGSGGRRVRRGLPSIDKENVPPEGSGSSRRRRRKRGSPLPAWYPRTPLRDITVVVKALERRRIRLREIAQNSKEDVAHSLRDTSPDDLFRRELIIAKDTSLSQHSPCVFSETTRYGKASNAPLESITSPSNVTLWKPPSCAVATFLAESERKLSRSIDEIERRLKERVRNTDKGTSNAYRQSTLMSMR